jgi:hypothetical protein
MYSTPSAAARRAGIIIVAYALTQVELYRINNQQRHTYNIWHCNKCEKGPLNPMIDYRKIQFTVVVETNYKISQEQEARCMIS